MNRATKAAPPTPLDPTRRHARSRAALAGRVIARVAEGESLAAISRRELMPRERTFNRWMEDDGALRARVEAARRARLQAMADEVIALADTYAATAPARKRSVAVRMQIDARKWWARTVASEIRDERRRGDAESHRAKSPDRNERSIADVLNERIRRYDESLRQEAEASARRAAGTEEPAPADEAPATVPAPVAGAVRPADAGGAPVMPEPIPTVVYAPRPPEPSAADGTNGGAGEKPGGAPISRDGRDALPRTPPAPSVPLVPQWFLDETGRPPEPPPYDPLRW